MADKTNKKNQPKESFKEKSGIEWNEERKRFNIQEKIWKTTEK